VSFITASDLYACCPPASSLQVVEKHAGEASGKDVDGWASEFSSQQTSAPSNSVWASEFNKTIQQDQAGQAAPSGWANEFSMIHQASASAAKGDWLDEFAKGVADIKLESSQEGLATAMEKAWGEAGGLGSWVDEFNNGEEATYEVRRKWAFAS
jgi:hypothetical protein